MKDFKDKIVVITGAGSGMGRAYAMAFARRGARLALNDYDQKALEATVALLPSGGTPRVLAKAFDVSDRAAMYAFADEVQREMGGAHVVINNAGIEASALPTWLTPDADYERVMRINYFGVVNGTKAFLPQMMARKEGAIVNVSSIMGLMGAPSQSDYCASKFAVRGFTESLMMELHDSPISVHLVHPGGIATNIVRKDQGKAFAKRYLTTPPEDIVEHVIQGIGRGRVRIVYGRGALRAWLGANLVPQRWLNTIIWRELKQSCDPALYQNLR